MHVIDDDDIHKGHRSRMRQKLMKHGRDIFDTYELLEMLLYHSIPYKDTNPISKRLLKRFGSLDGVLSASPQELTEVSDVGEKTAVLIEAVDNVSSVIGAERVSDNALWFGNYSSTAQYLMSYFQSNKETAFVIMTLDNSMRLIDFSSYSDLRFSSGTTSPRMFIDAVVRSNCAAVITAQNNYYSTTCITESDRETVRMISNTLNNLRVTYAEHYVMSGNAYAGALSKNPNIFSQSIDINGFFNSKPKNCVESGKEGFQMLDNAFCELANYSDIVRGNLEALISFGKRCTNAGDKAKALISKYLLVENAMSADTDALAEIVGRDAAVLLKVCSALASRRVTDKLTFGTRYTEAEIVEYLKALFLGIPVERVYALFLDKQERVLACELVGMGTVNFSEIWTRKIVETARKLRASAIHIAHNHPRGKAKPSEEDLGETLSLVAALSDAGITLKSHFIIAGQKHMILKAGMNSMILR